MKQRLKIHSDAGDKLPLELVYADQTCVVEWCDSYIYLGRNFTADGQDKHKQCLKFVSFISKNKDFPFPVKRKVLLSALMSSILYGSESWFTENLSTVNLLYMMSIKALFGVRQTTANDISLLVTPFETLGKAGAAELLETSVASQGRA